MGALVDDLLLLARLDQGRPLERAPVDLGAPGRRRGARRRGPSIPSGRSRPTSATRHHGARRRAPAAPGRGQPRRQRPACTPRRARRSRSRLAAAATRGVLEVRRRRTGHAARGRRAGLRALLPGRPVAVAPPRRQRARPRHRRRPSSRPTAARSASTPRPAGARPCASSCPSTRARHRPPHRPPPARLPSARAEGLVGEGPWLRAPTSRRCARSRRWGPDRRDRSSRPCSARPGRGRAG